MNKLEEMNTSIENLTKQVDEALLVLDAIRHGIINKGVEVAENAPASEYKQKIESIKSTPIVQETTITENGEYTPPEGCDGFSKVIVNVEISDAEREQIITDAITNMTDAEEMSV